MPKKRLKVQVRSVLPRLERMQAAVKCGVWPSPQEIARCVDQVLYQSQADATLRHYEENNL